MQYRRRRCPSRAGLKKPCWRWRKPCGSTPYPPIYLFELGVAYRLTGRYAEAIATLREAISRSPDFLYAHNYLANSYLWQWVAQQSPAAQTLEPAVAAAQRALGLNDSLHWNHIVLGWIYLYQQQ